MYNVVIGCRFQKYFGLSFVIVAIAFIVGMGTSVAGIT